MVDFHETSNVYPNLNALNIPSNDQNFRLNKINEIKIFFLLRLKKEN